MGQANADKRKRRLANPSSNANATGRRSFQIEQPRFDLKGTSTQDDNTTALAA